MLTKQNTGISLMKLLYFCAFRFPCLTISKDVLFHITRLKNPKEIWDQLASLFDKQDDPRIYQLENELISLHPTNFETLNDFFTKIQESNVSIEAVQG